jgi:hypothetical protein
MIGWLASSSDEEVASVRYRTLWPLTGLRQRGRAVSLYQPGAQRLYSGLIFSKRAQPADLYLAKKARARGTAIIFDLCDNHFYNPKSLPVYEALRTRLRRMLEMSDRVICSTERLAGVVQEELGSATDVVVVGDFVERIAIPKSASPSRRDRPMLLWFGSHGSDNADSGMLDLLKIADDLRRQFERAPFELVVVSNNRAKFDAYIAPLPLATRYLPWQRETFADLLGRAAAVLLPLSDNPFVACKTHNRISLALTAGVPVVGDLIQSYAEFSPYAYLGDWRQGLEAVVERPRAARSRARRARAYVDEVWSPSRVLDAWEAALQPFLHR